MRWFNLTRYLCLDMEVTEIYNEIYFFITYRNHNPHNDELLSNVNGQICR